MFLAPLLYALHAVATGVSMAVMDLLNVRLGFSFSAGLFDYVLNFSHAQHPLWLLPIGAVYFVLYYGVFRYCIVRFNLATPGREPDEAADAAPAEVAAGSAADGFIAALGGASNLTEVEACTTRLRLGIADGARVDEGALRRLGARGFVRPSPTSLQVVLGPIADQVAGEIRNALRTATAAAPTTAHTATAQASTGARDRTIAPAPTSAQAPTAAHASAAADRQGHDPRALLKSLGGAANVLELSAVPGRLLLRLARAELVNDEALHALGVRGVARSAGGALHVLVSGPVDDTAVPLRALLGHT
jgi:PTS system N-acetylglucosamine-specific IIC component